MMLSARLWRYVLLTVILVLVAFSPLPGSPDARAAEDSLDTPGTYLVEVGSGRTMSVGRSALVAWSPDSKTAAVAELGAESQAPTLQLVTVPEGTTRVVPIALRGEINQLRWSPDGSHLAFTLTRMGQDPGPALMVVEVSSGMVEELVPGSIGPFVWTNDSVGITAIMLDNSGGSIVILDIRDGRVRETVADARDASCQRGLAWSPDGAFLAYGGPGLREGCGDAGNWGIWTWERRTGTLRQVFQGAADAPQWLAAGDVVAMISEPESNGVPPLALVRFAPDGSATEPIASDLPRMFPQPPRLFQAAGDSVMFPVSTCDRGEAHFWTVGQQDSERVTTEDIFAYRPALSPDATTLAYVRLGKPHELVLDTIGAGTNRVLARSSLGLQVGTAGPWDIGGDWSPDGQWLAIEVTSEQFTDCAP